MFVVLDSRAVLDGSNCIVWLLMYGLGQPLIHLVTLVVMMLSVGGC